IAEDALLRLAGVPVIVNLLVGAPRHTHPPSAALVLVDKDDAVLFALVDGAGRTGGDARRIEAVLAQSRQIHHERVFEFAVDVLLHVGEVVVLRPFGELATKNLLPVRAPLDFVHSLPRDQRYWARRGRGWHLGCRLEELVVVGERLVVVVDLRQVRIGEDLEQHAEPAPLLEPDAPVVLALPTSLPPLLILPVFWISDPGFGLDIVEPRVFHPD